MENSSPISKDDVYLFHEGNLFASYYTFGAHLTREHGIDGVRFTVWAPRAIFVRVVGNFNNWDGTHHVLQHIKGSGIWTIFVPHLGAYELYKYEIHTPDGTRLLKADPYAFYAEVKPNTASVVYPLATYEWGDQEWQGAQQKRNAHESPLNIYEVHLGSWRHNDDRSYYTYRQLATELIPYVLEMGYTHIELLPITEHPYDRSWGYQATGYYAPTSRFGTPNDFKYFIDQCHQHHIGVLLDWVPAHFCKDDHGLRLFDGTPQFEYTDPFLAEKEQWGTLAFDLGKPEVHSFLISNALFWLREYHIDGFRVDAVASMLYVDFGREDEQWIQKAYGGRENKGAVAFLRKLNEVIFREAPWALMIAEESSAWPLVSAPTHDGGLGFNFKWNMGWMNDILTYMKHDPLHRKEHHDLLTFSFMYTFSENFVLPLSHDEVVYGKRSLLHKMPGDYWQKFANLRLLFAYMMVHPGKKLLFMGGEFGQFDEWKDLDDLDWELLDYPSHQGMQTYVRALNHMYLQERALWELDHDPEGFLWLDPHDREQSVVTFMRRGKTKGDYLLIVCNFTPIVRYDYRIGVPKLTTYDVILNSDLAAYGGTGDYVQASVTAEKGHHHHQAQHVRVTLPPLAALLIKPAST